MALVTTRRRNSFPTFNSLIDELLNDNIPTFNNNIGYALKSVPNVNIRENNDAILLELAAPGMTKEDFKIDLENDYLTISSEKEENKETIGEYKSREFSYNNFSRSFVLPDTVDQDKIEAKYENGILAIALIKKDEAKPKEPKSIVIK